LTTAVVQNCVINRKIKMCEIKLLWVKSGTVS